MVFREDTLSPNLPRADRQLGAVLLIISALRIRGGGNTKLMTSGLELPVNVRGIVSDCGFTSPKEVFTHVLNNMYHLPAGIKYGA